MEDNVEFKGPLGWSVKANGAHVTLLILMAVSAAAILWALRDHDLRAAAALSIIAQERRMQIEQLAMQQQRLQDGLDTVVYMLSLSPEDRARLKLEMPGGLRTKLLAQERQK